MMSSGSDHALPGSRYESDVGNDLRAAREGLGWSLDEVGASLRIKPLFLRAIEEGRIHDLPGNAYAVGFLRAYAALVRLDPDDVTRRFRTETRDVNRKTALEFPAPVPDRGVPAGAVVLLGVVLAIGAYVGWYKMSGDRQTTAVVQQVPERLATLAEPPKPAPAPATTAIPPTSAAAATTPLPMMPAIAPAPVVDDSRITVRARTDTWVQVRDAKGAVLLNRVLRPGESWSVPPKPQLLLTTGNAGGMDLLVDGVLAPALNSAGGVRRDLPLDADLIKEGKLPAQMAAATRAPAAGQ